MADAEVLSDEMLLVRLLRKRRRRDGEIEEKPNRVWAREILRWRKEQGYYHSLVRELRLGGREFYFLGIFVRCMTMREKQILASLGAIEIPKENR